MKKEAVEISLNEQVNTIGGIKGFIILQAWPFIKDIFIDLFIELLQGDDQHADIKVRNLKGIKGFLARKVWPIIKFLFIELLLKSKKAR